MKATTQTDGTQDQNFREVARRLDELGARDTCKAIVARYGCNERSVYAGSRHRWAARARRHCWMLLRHTLDLSYPEIGQAWGVDHTTVLMGVRMAERELEARVAS